MYGKKTFLEVTAPMMIAFYKKNNRLEQLVEHRKSIGSRVFISVVEWQEDGGPRMIGYVEYFPDTGKTETVVRECEVGEIEKFK